MGSDTGNAVRRQRGQWSGTGLRQGLGLDPLEPLSVHGNRWPEARVPGPCKVCQLLLGDIGAQRRV